MPPKDEQKGCTFGQVSREKIGNIEKTMIELTGWMQRLDQGLKDAIKRPGWAVLLIISTLSSLCVALLVTLFRMKGDS